MEERTALLAKCEEFLAFLAAHDEHAKLRRLSEDIEALRDRLRAEVDEPDASSPGGRQGPA